jgi:anaerobic ribonucleoside-triphosphate reductase activating protein
MTVPISLSRAHFPVTTLGPGARIGIWFQGCSIRCPGCISADTWAADGPATTVEAVLGLAVGWAPEADGVTISGGEPFDQPEALIALLVGLRPRLAGTADVLVFSGHPYAKIRPVLEAAAGLIDAIITDPFLLEAPQTLALRGSDNQRLHALTALGERRLRPFERTRTADDDRLDLMADEHGTFWMAGIPRRGDLERLREILAAEGALVRTSEHRAALRASDSR